MLATTTEKLMNPWDQIKRHLEDRISPDAFQNWVARSSFRRSEGDTLVVAASDEATKSFLETEYSDAIHTSLRDLGLPYSKVVFHCSDANLPAALPAVADTPSRTPICSRPLQARST